MDSIIKSEIFFFITSIAVIVLSIGAAVVLVYAVRVLRDVDHVAKLVRDESDLIAKDVSHLREEAEEEGMKAGRFIKFIIKYFKKYAKNKK